ILRGCKDVEGKGVNATRRFVQDNLHPIAETYNVSTLESHPGLFIGKENPVLSALFINLHAAGIGHVQTIVLVRRPARIVEIRLGFARHARDRVLHEFLERVAASWSGTRGWKIGMGQAMDSGTLVADVCNHVAVAPLLFFGPKDSAS